ncbi:MAG: hypothetical protein WCG31_05400 [Deltaproteobacteria bacterium]
MKLLKKYFGAFIIPLYLFSPLVGNVLANQISSVNWLNGKGLCTVNVMATDPPQSLSPISDDEGDLDNECSSYRSHLPLMLSTCGYSPLKTHLDIMEIRKKLSYVYASIFVPPQ